MLPSDDDAERQSSPSLQVVILIMQNDNFHRDLSLKFSTSEQEKAYMCRTMDCAYVR